MDHSSYIQGDNSISSFSSLRSHISACQLRCLRQLRLIDGLNAFDICERSIAVAVFELFWYTWEKEDKPTSRWCLQAPRAMSDSSMF
jgi:hypothetical protein